MGYPTGPAFGDYYLEALEPKRDVAKASCLLQEAGASNLHITLMADDVMEVPKTATVWKKQVAEADVTVDINIVPPDSHHEDDGRSFGTVLLRHRHDTLRILRWK